jgi:hypothetical protein
MLGLQELAVGMARARVGKQHMQGVLHTPVLHCCMLATRTGACLGVNVEQHSLAWLL